MPAGFLLSFSQNVLAVVSLEGLKWELLLGSSCEQKEQQAAHSTARFNKPELTAGVDVA